MPSPTADDRMDGDRERCDECTDPIETSEWYPVATERTNGDLTVHSFCSKICKEEFLDD